MFGPLFKSSEFYLKIITTKQWNSNRAGLVRPTVAIMRIRVKMRELFRVMPRVKLMISVVSKPAQICISGYLRPPFFLDYTFINILKKEAKYENAWNETFYVVYVLWLHNTRHKIFHIVERVLQSTTMDI